LDGGLFFEALLLLLPVLLALLILLALLMLLALLLDGDGALEDEDDEVEDDEDGRDLDDEDFFVLGSQFVTVTSTSVFGLRLSF
jgi:hypothetical protein